MTPITSNCIRCGDPIRNTPDRGRPDLWIHTTDGTCQRPDAPYKATEALPMETRLVSVRVSERVTHVITKPMVVHVGVTDEELPSYMAMNEEQWVDDMTPSNEYANDDREVDPDTTVFADADYLAKVRKALEAGGENIRPWLTDTCPDCRNLPDNTDTEITHQVIGDYIVLGCQGLMVINPNALGIHMPHWQDWTADAITQA
ncbi:hypothetical protein AB0C10_16205 [Microbispora amethystogenes]|uniref:hypothetical protein n=1 Tax=Microbispora amethystogenes TaxID=1427754 RepID=UPI0033D31AD8